MFLNMAAPIKSVVLVVWLCACLTLSLQHVFIGEDMKLKELESHLQAIEVFDKPNILLEQYPTSPHIAACMLQTIDSRFGDIAGKSVLDLGCGCGVLSIGAAILGAGLCTGVDVDESALEVCQRNIAQFELDNIEILQCDVTHLCGDVTDLRGEVTDVRVPQLFAGKRFHTTIMNPPFGTKRSHGIDMKFVQVALNCTTNAVYSLHKTSTRQFVKKKGREWGVHVDILAQLSFNIDQSFKCHKKQSVDVDVDFIRFSFVK